jgi:hypothetical protein
MSMDDENGLSRATTAAHWKPQQGLQEGPIGVLWEIDPPLDDARSELFFQRMMQKLEERRRKRRLWAGLIVLTVGMMAVATAGTIAARTFTH